MTAVAKCPNCQNGLAKPPTRKKKCPHCGEYMYVRAGEAYTEEQVKEFDFLRPWLVRLESKYRISEEDFEDYRQELSNQFGFRASSSDTVWKVLNSQISEIRTYPTEKHRSRYLEMAYFVRAESKDPRRYLESANKVQSDLIKKKIQQEVVTYSWLSEVKWEFFNANDELVCSSCRELSEKALSEEEAIRLPLRCTGDYGCRCWVHVSPESRDYEGLADFDVPAATEENGGRPWWKFWE